MCRSPVLGLTAELTVDSDASWPAVQAPPSPHTSSERVQRPLARRMVWYNHITSGDDCLGRVSVTTLRVCSTPVFTSLALPISAINLWGGPAGPGTTCTSRNRVQSP